ncbi:hypothetical protein ES703_50706 [subsurface metagenome]
MPQAKFTINGDIKDFTRLDNLYVSLKRETIKLLEKWNIDVEVKYTETEATQKE